MYDVKIVEYYKLMIDKDGNCHEIELDEHDLARINEYSVIINKIDYICYFLKIYDYKVKIFFFGGVFYAKIQQYDESGKKNFIDFHFNHSSFMEKVGIRSLGFHLIVKVVPENRLTTDEITLLDNTAKLILVKLIEIDRVNSLWFSLDKRRFEAFWLDSQKLFLHDVYDYWKEVRDRDWRLIKNDIEYISMTDFL